MRALRPSEYTIITESLEKKGTIPRNTTWEELPRDVRVAIANYQGRPDRFEIFKGSLTADHCVVLSYYCNEGKAQMYVAAEYLNGAFADERVPITDAMIAKLEEATEEKWSWSKIDKGGRQYVSYFGVPLFVVGVLAWAGIYFFGHEMAAFFRADIDRGLPLFLLYFFAIGFGTVMGMVATPITLLIDWLQYRKKRLFLESELRWFTTG